MEGRITRSHEHNGHISEVGMPVFNGSDRDGWILRVEQYFAFYRLTTEEMLEVVVVASEGDAHRWYQCEQKRRPIRFWIDLKVFMLRQFQPTWGGGVYLLQPRRLQYI